MIDSSSPESGARYRLLLAVAVTVVVVAVLCGALLTGGKPRNQARSPAATTVSSAGTAQADLPLAVDPACGGSGVDPPTCGIWWGAALDVTDSNLVAQVAAREKATGRRLDIVHSYHRWYDPFPTANERMLAASSHALFLNWEPVDQNNVALSWAAIANGVYDAQIDALATRLKSLGTTVYLSFSHEPELRFAEHGSAVDFVDAFRHVHDRMQSRGASRVSWVWNVMGLSTPVWLQRYQLMWPGSAYVDWVAWDPYNWSTCRDKPWQSFLQIVQPFYAWLSSHGFGAKPFMLAEYGSIEQVGTPAGKAEWLAGIPQALGELPNLRALVYFDLPAPPANCNWQITTSGAATAAYAALARSTAFAGTAKLSPVR